MRRHHLLRTAALAIPAVLALTLSACGDDSEPAADEAIDSVVDTTAPPSTTVPPTTVPPTTVPPTFVPPTTAAPDGFVHPTGVDEVVVSVEYTGGFTTREARFSQLPALVVSGDAHRFTPGPQIAIYPGPLLPNVQVADIGEDGIQDLLTLADEHGLFQEREYEAPTNVADASDTVVTIQANGATSVHRAYALGIGAGPGQSDETGDRAELEAFVEAATRMGAGETEAYTPEAFLVRSFPVDDLSGFEVEPTVTEWPLDDVRLAAASDCVEIPAADVGPTFADANQLTFFDQNGTTYQLAVKPQLPGLTC